MADDFDDLFSYAAGGLDAAGRARIEARLAAEPALRERLAWYEAVCDSFIDTLPPLGALPPVDSILRKSKTAPGFFAWLAGPGLRPVTAIAAVLIVAQGVVIGWLARPQEETPTVRSVAPAAKPVIFVVAFDPDTPEAKIRGLLLKAGATIVDGPRQLGDYRVSVPANRAQYAKQLFEESGIAEYVRLEDAK